MPLAAHAPHPPAQAKRMEDMFAQAFVGVFASRTDYTEHHMHAQGWINAVTGAGMDPTFIDVAGVRRHLFQRHVTDVDTDDGNRSIVVLHRPTGPA